MDILDKLADLLRSESIIQLGDCGDWACAGCSRGGDSAATIKHQPDCDVAEALAEYERVRARTVVLTFEKAKDVADGLHAVLFTYEGECVKDAMLVVCGGVHLDDGDYASCPLPKLPGPEVFGKETA